MSAQHAVAIPLPLSAEKSAQLEHLVQGLDPSGLLWVSGYAAGLARTGVAPALAASPVARIEAQPSATVLYGTQTGNSRSLAERLKQRLESLGVACRVLRASEYPLRELKHERHLLIVISTQGDGDPPDDARAFVEFLASRKAPALDALRYAVLALGDSSYPRYCAVGRGLDERLGQLGAKRITPLVECDLDFDAAAGPWIDAAGSALRDLGRPAPPLAAVTPLRRPEPVTGHDRRHPFAAPVLTNQRITARDAGKDVRHIELGLAGSGIDYEPGDALGIWPRNPAATVRTLLETLHLDGDSEVTLDGRTLPLQRWLAEERELTRLSRPVIARHAELARDSGLAALLLPEAQADLARLLRDYQVVDLLRAWSAQWNAQELVAMLRPLSPRSYSIASSRKLADDEAHLTVAVVDYMFQDLRHQGAASSHLADDATGQARVYLEPNPGFRLPTDPSRDVIMIGPGTGVAPFRGFVQERSVLGAQGRNWLFFGEQHFHSQFLYQSEWLEALKRGQLHRLDVAFSRDQPEKVYVQQRLQEQGQEVFRWLEDGAHLYVCGDAKRMSRDVHAALTDIVSKHGGRDQEQAAGYLSELQRQGRYARDVY